ncbi:MAG: TRAP transporter large permease [Paracoccaceae bacterium]
MSIIAALVLLLILLAIGLPVALSLGLSGALGLWLVGGPQLMLGILATAPGSAISSYELLTIPMFLLMAEFMVASGISNTLFDAVACWTARLRGGLGIATAITGAAFGAISGSSTAAAATLSTSSVPSMIRQGYEARFASGIVAVSGTLAMLIPPSIAIIFYGLLSGTDVGKLLIAGLLPGILVTLTVVLTIRFMIWRNPRLSPAVGQTSWAEKLGSLRIAGPFIGLFLLVTGSIYLGVATPVEASALGASGAMILTLVSGAMSRQVLVTALFNTIATSAMIGLIIVCASFLGYFLTITGVTRSMIAWITESGISPHVVLLLLILLYLALGCFLDQLSILILTVPVVHPLIVSMGFDPIWFGILIILLAEIGMVTPPVGLNLFVVARATGQPVDDVVVGVVPHVIAHLLLIVIIVIFPQIILWLPNSM